MSHSDDLEGRPGTEPNPNEASRPEPNKPRQTKLEPKKPEPRKTDATMMETKKSKQNAPGRPKPNKKSMVAAIVKISAPCILFIITLATIVGPRPEDLTTNQTMVAMCVQCGFILFYLVCVLLYAFYEPVRQERFLAYHIKNGFAWTSCLTLLLGIIVTIGSLNYNFLEILIPFLVTTVLLVVTFFVFRALPIDVTKLGPYLMLATGPLALADILIGALGSAKIVHLEMALVLILFNWHLMEYYVICAGIMWQFIQGDRRRGIVDTEVWLVAHTVVLVFFTVVMKIIVISRCFRLIFGGK